jgi:NAD(P)-dependent dehydrogenase (short-subunit alcohol dehydrogenase family)
VTAATTGPPTQREPELLGQTVVVIGGSAGIGLETARRARAEGADVVLAARDPEPLQRAALELDARSTAAFDATISLASTGSSRSCRNLSTM